jgi:hypothetical protein
VAVNVWTDLEKRYATTHYHACERPTDEIELSAVGHTPRAPGASERRAFAAVVLLRSIRCAHLCVTEYRPRTATLYHTGHPRSWAPSCLTDSLLSRLIRARDSNSWPMPARRSRRAFFLPSMRACVRRGFGRPFPARWCFPSEPTSLYPSKHRRWCGQSVRRSGQPRRPSCGPRHRARCRRTRRIARSVANLELGLANCVVSARRKR